MVTADEAMASFKRNDHARGWALSRDAARALVTEIERLRVENREMRRTFGSAPLFQEKDAEIERLRTIAGAK